MDIDKPEIRLVDDQEMVVQRISAGLEQGLRQILHPVNGHVNHSNHLEIEATIGKTRFTSGRSNIPRFLPVVASLPPQIGDSRAQQRTIPSSWKRQVSGGKADFRALSAQVIHAANKSLMALMSKDVFGGSSESKSCGFRVLACTGWGIDADVTITQTKLGVPSERTKTRITSWKHQPQDVICTDYSSFDDHTRAQLGLDTLYDHDIWTWKPSMKTMRHWTFRPSSDAKLPAGSGLQSDTLASSIGSHALARMTRHNVDRDVSGDFPGGSNVGADERRYLLAKSSSYVSNDACNAIQKTKVVETVTLRSELSDIFDMTIAISTEISVAAVSMVGHRLHPTSILSLDCLKMFKPPTRSAQKKTMAAKALQAQADASVGHSPHENQSQLATQDCHIYPNNSGDDDLKHDSNYIPAVTIDAKLAMSQPTVSVKCRKSVFVVIDNDKNVEFGEMMDGVEAGDSNTVPTWRIDLTCVWRDSNTSLRDLSSVAFAYKMHLDRIHMSTTAPMGKFEFDQIVNTPNISSEALESKSGVDRYVPAYEIEFELLNPAKYIADLGGSVQEAAQFILRDFWILQDGLRNCMSTFSDVGPADTNGNILPNELAFKIPEEVSFLFKAE